MLGAAAGGWSDVDTVVTGNDRATVKLITMIHAKHPSDRRGYCVVMDNKSNSV